MRSLIFLAALSLVACSSPDKSTDAGPPSAPACTATTTPKTLIEDFTRGTRHEAMFAGDLVPPSLVGDELYYIDTSEGGPAANGNFNNGVIKHIKLDGSGQSTLVTPTGYLFQAIALDADIFYLQEEQTSKAPDMYAVHLYRSPRATGGPGTVVGTASFYLGNAGLFVARCGDPCGVVARRGDDVFINAAGEIDRVSLSTGQVTVVAKPMPARSLWAPILDGDTLYYQDGDGTVYSVSASTNAPNGTSIGVKTCGAGARQGTRRYGKAFICSDRDSIFTLDATGSTQTSFFQSQSVDPRVASFTPTPVDGTTVYAMPEFVFQDLDKTSSVYKVDINSGNPTPVLCNVHTVVWSTFGPTQIVYVEATKDAAQKEMFSLRTVPR